MPAPLPRANHNARMPAMRGEPAPRPCPLAQTAMQCDDRRVLRTLNTGAEDGLNLWREIDFRYKHQCLCIRSAGESSGEQAQIDLGFAAAGHAMQQKRRKPACRIELLQRLRLSGSERGRGDVDF